MAKKPDEIELREFSAKPIESEIDRIEVLETQIDIDARRPPLRSNIEDEIEVLPDVPKPKHESNPMLDEMTPSLNPTKKLTVFLKKRWLVMGLVALLNFSNSFSWIGYAPVGNYVNAYYGEQSAAWFSMIFMFVTIPFSFATIWVGTSTKVKSGLLLAAVPNSLGSLVRWLSSIPAADYNVRFHICLTGQGLAALTYPFLMFLPSKVSDSWFPPSERTIATTIGVMANPAGVLTANLLSPLMVQSSSDVWILNTVLFGLCTLTLVAVILGIQGRSTQENERTEQMTKTYHESMKDCFSNLSYVIILISLGGGIGMFNSLYTMMLQMMCPSGHKNDLAGICAVIMIVCGMIGATIASYVVDMYQLYKPVMVASMIGASTFGIGFIWTTRLEGWIGTSCIIVCAIFLGTFGLAAYPVGLELAMECVFPIAPEVPSGFIVLTGQLFSVLFVWIMTYFSTPINSDDSKFGNEGCRIHAQDSINIPHDFFVPIIIVTVIAVFLALITLLIEPKYKRSDSDKAKRFHVSKTEANDFLDMIAKATETTFIDPPAAEAPKKKKRFYFF